MSKSDEIVECWKCKTKTGVRIRMNGVFLKAVHNREHAKELIEQFEMGRIGRIRDDFELVPTDLSLPTAPLTP
jgi:hypothetical protein